MRGFLYGQSSGESDLFWRGREQVAGLEREIADAQARAEATARDCIESGLRGRLDLASEARVARLAELNRQIAETQRREAEDRERARERDAASRPETSRTETATSTTARAGRITVNFSPKVFEDIPAGTVSGWARQIGTELDRIARRGR